MKNFKLTLRKKINKKKQQQHRKQNDKVLPQVFSLYTYLSDMISLHLLKELKQKCFESGIINQNDI